MSTQKQHIYIPVAVAGRVWCKPQRWCHSNQYQDTEFHKYHRLWRIVYNIIIKCLRAVPSLLTDAMKYYVYMYFNIQIHVVHVSRKIGAIRTGGGERERERELLTLVVLSWIATICRSLLQVSIVGCIVTIATGGRLSIGIAAVLG